MPERIDLDRTVDEEEALEITLDGEIFRVTDLTQEHMEHADRLIKAARTQDPPDPYAVHEQLAFLLGAPAERFRAVGYRKINKAFRLIYDHLGDLRGPEGKGDGQARPRG